MAQFCHQGPSYSLAGAFAKSNLPAVLMRKIQPPGDVCYDAAYFGGLSEFEAQRSKIHGGYQLSKKAHYAEPRMDVNRKTRLRVSPADRPEIAGAFRLARKDLGLTQSELAERLGSSQGAITRWERGKDSPPISALLALSNLVSQEKRAFWLEAAGMVESVNSPQELVNAGLLPPPKQDFSSNIIFVPLLRDAVAAGTPRAVNANDVAADLPFLKTWLPRAGCLYALKVSGDSMSPIINDGYVVIVDVFQRDPKLLEGQMVAAREGDGVTIKWLRKDKDFYLLVPQHVSPRIPVKIMRSEDDWGIVGVVVKWIGYPSSARK
jgi:SOS-response transcriptional repressor LexA